MWYRSAHMNIYMSQLNKDKTPGNIVGAFGVYPVSEWHVVISI